MMYIRTKGRKNSRDGYGWVYVAGAPGVGRIKVGTTTFLDPRIAGLRKAAGGKAHCFYAVYTEHRRWVESRAHRMLRRFDLGHEWFGCAPFIAAIAVSRAADAA